MTRWRPVSERLVERIDRSGGMFACWPFTGAHNRRGYGLFKTPTQVLAHRAVWEFTHGPIPPGMHVCHHCDNPPCCNPLHLFIGTNAYNVADRVAKGRPRFGAEWGGKLTDDDVRSIRSSSAPIRSLGPRYGVAYSTISAIRRRTRYGRVPDVSLAD